MQTLVDTDTNKSFTGKLVQRQYKRGQPYAQLVFKGARQTQLSLSRNARMLQSLKVGETYRIVGPEHQIGERAFIHEPEVTLVTASKKRWAVVSVAAFLCILTGTVLAARHFAAGNDVQAQNNSAATQANVEGASTISTNQDTASTAPVADNPAPVVAQTPAPKPVARPAAVTPVTPAVQQSTAPTQDQTSPVDPPTQPDPPVQPETPPTDDTPPPVEDPPVIPPAEPVDPAPSE
ncbi:MAG TPA: hypothetical protein VLI54_01405 [Bacillota bacterium]|nr:hypothetical protein [Bacillota bacterium]